MSCRIWSLVVSLRGSPLISSRGHSILFKVPRGKQVIQEVMITYPEQTNRQKQRKFTEIHRKGLRAHHQRSHTAEERVGVY